MKSGRFPSSSSVKKTSSILLHAGPHQRKCAPFCAHEPCAGVVRASLETQLGSVTQLWVIRAINVTLWCYIFVTMVDTSPCGLLDPSSPQNSLWLYPRTVAQFLGSLLGSELCRLICLYIDDRSKKCPGHYEEQDLYLRTHVNSLSYYLTPTKSSDGVTSKLEVIHVQQLGFKV